MCTLLCTIVSLVQSLYVEYHILICIVSLIVIIGQILINHLSQIKLAVLSLQWGLFHENNVYTCIVMSHNSHTLAAYEYTYNT